MSRIAPDDRPPEDAASARLLERIAQLEAQLHAAHQAREEATEAEELLKGLFAAVPAFIIRYDADYRLKAISRMQPGFDRAQVLGTNFFDYMPPEHHSVAREAVERCLATGEPQRYQVSGMGPHGQPADYESYVAPVKDADGSTGFVLVAIDVTSQNAQALALRKSESMLDLALEAAGVALWAVELRSQRVTWNDHAFQLFGHPEALLPGDYARLLVHPDDQASVLADMQRPLLPGRFAGPPHRIIRPDGELRWVSTIRDVLCDERGQPTHIIGGTMDVTQQHEREMRARGAQRMEAMGQLTAGIAHNFNNMLAAIVPALDLMRPVIPSDLDGIAAGAQKAAARATEMVRQLMTFAGKRNETPRAVSVALVVSRSLEICRNAFERHVSLSVEVLDDVDVFVAAADLEQAVVNLLINARDAVLASSRIDKRVLVRVRRVEATPTPDEPPSVSLYACIEVEDNGVGMTPEVQAHIFEPFFTTKDVGRGTGLGLALAHAVVKQAGGCTGCRSAPGEGTQLSFYLPAVEATLHDGERMDRGDSAVSLGIRDVLVVDDEDDVAAATAALLQRHGLRVWRASTLAQALDLARELPSIELVLLDRSMPGGPADLILPDLRKHLPRARVLFFTGQDLDADQAALVDGVVFKPVNDQALLAQLFPQGSTVKTPV
ncbi:MAG: PAS domain S-box protein [Myxococcales bacterium]|nr:PAS domain S-box protein [Myxococcales bacterium]